VKAYRWLLEEKQYDPKHIIIAGDSAGGGLTLALALYLRDHKMALPAGLITMSPWADVTCSGESYDTNYTKDPQFGNTRESMLYHSPYIGEADPHDPYLSPVFGTYEGMPPILMQAGGDEMLLSDTLRVAEKFRKAQRKLRVTVYDGMFHMFQMALNMIPESKEAWEEVTRFLHIIYGLDQKPDGRVVRRIKSKRT